MAPAPFLHLDGSLAVARPQPGQPLKGHPCAPRPIELLSKASEATRSRQPRGGVVWLCCYWPILVCLTRNRDAVARFVEEELGAKEELGAVVGACSRGDEHSVRELLPCCAWAVRL